MWFDQDFIRGQGSVQGRQRGTENRNQESGAINCPRSIRNVLPVW